MVRLEREMAMSAVAQVGKTTPLDGTSRACERLRMAADLESGASRCLLLLAARISPALFIGVVDG
jgi:hypothetical protein